MGWPPVHLGRAEQHSHKILDCAVITKHFGPYTHCASLDSSLYMHIIHMNMYMEKFLDSKHIIKFNASQDLYALPTLPQTKVSLRYMYIMYVALRFALRGIKFSEISVLQKNRY
jgi:hypothetical protein